MRCLRPGGRRRCPLLGGDTAAFCVSLVDGLAHLESTLRDGGSSVSMRWCVDAMRMVKRMQRELLDIFKKADVPVGDVSYGGVGDGDGECWFEHYMQETAALLDFCNAFKSAVSRLHRYCMVVDFAAQVGCAAAGVSLVSDQTGAATIHGWWLEEPNDATSSTVRDRLSAVKAVVSETERLGRKIMSTSSISDGTGGMVVVMLVAKITMAVVSLFVLQALTSPIPTDADGRRCTLGCAAVPFPELQSWRESLSVINDRFPRPASVAEHERVAMVVKAMINAKMEGEERTVQEDDMMRHVELLRTRSVELREGVEMFDCVLDEVFDEVIKGRSEMLGIFRDKALTFS
ncbi:hypothetical protein GUJ93_ZPchr0011g27500 [Zizania palustris]|uniref:Uncharacterized protein n=1 Tax=Zizania palustris TaxID=103762 RepID=A0A8J5WIP7_ZIZPA|nr:hypothetical protein GUJ93_ZPchr0011g27500 [Zizania palustris]